MAVDQLPGGLREFANYLKELLGRLDQSGGWCGVFWQRDPDGMQACLDGREVPPWDVVEALLQDFTTKYGSAFTGPEKERARSLHAAALAAYDARPGARDDLGDRLDVMLREQRYAAERQAELSRLIASAATREEADALRLDLAWARDDHERATARCAELRARMTELDRRGHGAEAMSWAPGDGDGAVIRVDAEDSADGARPGGHGPYGGESPTVPRQREAQRTAAAGTTNRAAAANAPTEAGGRDAGQRTAGRVAADWRAAQRATGTTATDPHNPGPGHPADRHAADGAAGGYGSARAADRGFGAPAPGAFGLAEPAHHAYGSQAADTPEPPAADSDPAASPATATPKQRKRRRGSARFAGMVEEEAAPVVVPPAVPTLPTPTPATGRTLRGARFAGVAAEPVEPVEQVEPQAEAWDTGDLREVAQAVEALARLRGEGRSGEAHALLVEAAYWPAARFPLLAAEMQRAGLGADWTTLLWETASLPADRLVAAADALVTAGRADDGQQILRQGVVRPPGEIGRAVLALADDGRRREIRALLDAYVRVRTPEEAARSAEPDPQQLVPLLLEAAQGVSDQRHWDLLHALRVAGLAT